MRRSGLRLTLLLTAFGCAYYNGLWRANRFASEAERAERDGRVGEARSLWARAAVRAESVVIRHPDSKWMDDALLLHGRALREMQQCVQALVPLERATGVSADREIVEAAALLAGECRVQLGDAAGARALLDGVVGSDHPGRASRAHYWRGIAAQRLGDHQAARADLEASREAGSGVARTVSLLALGELDAARPLLDSLLEADAVESDWTQVVAALTDAAPLEAERLLEQVGVKRSGLGLGARGRLILAAAVRAMRGADTTRALRLLDRVKTVAPDSAAAREAEVQMVTIALSRAETLADILPLVARLDTVAAQGGEAGRLATRLAALARRVAEPPDHEGGRFLSAEVAADSLQARHLAAWVWLELARRSPESLFAPKALLAAALARPELADSLRAMLRQRYPGSPYLLALEGRPSPGYLQLEDSLLALSGGAPGPRISADGSRGVGVETGPPWVPLPDATPLGRGGRPR